MSIDDRSQRSGNPPAMRIVALGFIAVIAGLSAWTAFGSNSDPDSVGAPVTASPADEAPGEAAELQEPPPDLGAMPDLVNISGWLNTETGTFEEIRGDVTIVQFWTFGCSNCKATLPHLQALYADRHDDGLEIIGVHAHEFEHERDPDNVAAAVEDLGVIWPVALDTDKTSFVEWQGSPRYWPRTYVIDSDDRIRFDHVGEGDYEELAETVDYLLAEQA